MDKILYIDDDRLNDKPQIDLKHVMTVTSAYNEFAGHYVYDVVSLDGRMPFEVPDNDRKEFDIFINEHILHINKNRPLWSEINTNNVKNYAGIYLLFLMKRFNYIPKVLLLHSHDHNLKVMMGDITTRMFYNEPIVITFVNKNYIFESKSTILIQQALDKQKEYFQNHDSEKVYIKLEKGKNHFIVTPEAITFYKKNIKQNSKPTIYLPSYVKDKISEGYDITHGNEYLTGSEYMRTPNGTHFYGKMEFKTSPIHF